MKELKEFAERIANFTPSEAKELKEILEDTYGIEAPNTDVVVFDNVEVEEVETQTEFDVILENSGASKLGIVKLVKQMLGLGLREAKTIVDAAPTAIKEAVSDMEAQSLKSELEAAGATVTIV